MACHRRAIACHWRAIVCHRRAIACHSVPLRAIGVPLRAIGVPLRAIACHWCDKTCHYNELMANNKCDIQDVQKLSMEVEKNPCVYDKASGVARHSCARGNMCWWRPYASLQQRQIVVAIQRFQQYWNTINFIWIPICCTLFFYKKYSYNKTWCWKNTIQKHDQAQTRFSKMHENHLMFVDWVIHLSFSLNHPPSLLRETIPLYGGIKWLISDFSYLDIIKFSPTMVEGMAPFRLFIPWYFKIFSNHGGSNDLF